MITTKVDKQAWLVSTDGSYGEYQEYYGNSSDTKPTTGVANGSAFIEMDTKKIYLFNASAASGYQWVEQ